MSTWTSKAHLLREAQAEILAEILLDIDPTDPVLDTHPHYASAAGSERALRGIPVVGAQGVGGTITGTNPINALLTKERWRSDR